ncbi:hypothetical protein KAK06_10565 [Ideonella sp. 4Y11]|uniref:Uncharacterized protein n=1 Tax=Ideonella aquatica TaxID=2824119 RepID=A0A940YLY0_9BURK|nr:hypothetical protein [Ideonella aquatica]MBQ0959392.1 hypothetical protein [Ideonella aquatica]
MTPSHRAEGAQVFVMASVAVPAITRWALSLAALGVVLIGWQLYALFPPAIWREALARTLDGRGAWGGPRWLAALAPLMAAGLVAWGTWMQRRHGRLTLNERTLSYASGVPLFARWLDWQLALDDLRSGRTRLRLTGLGVGSQGLALIRLGWGLSGLRGLRPAVWRPLGQGSAEASSSQPPHRPLGYINWRHPANAAWLQQRFEALPLIQALRAQGVVLPAWTSLRDHAAGADLMAHPRLRVVLLALAALTVSGAVLLHLSRFQHYVQPWSSAHWLAIGALIGTLTLAWFGVLAPPMPADPSSRWSLRVAQWLSAAMMVVVLGWNLHQAPLAWARAFSPAQPVSCVLDTDAARLRPEGASPPCPEIAVDLSAPYWRAQADGSTHTLILRRGWGGRWTQYDTEALNRRPPGPTSRGHP